MSHIRRTLRLLAVVVAFTAWAVPAGMAGEDAASDAAFQPGGIVRAWDIGEIFDTFPHGPWFLLLAAPGGLFLTRSWRRSADDSVGLATSNPALDGGPQNSVLRVAIVVASTHHGNTRKVAQAMAGELKATVLSPEQVNAAELADFDLVGFGSGVYFGRHDGSLRRLIQSLPHVPPVAFLFSTAGLSFLSWFFHWPLRRLLSQRGSHIVGEFSCRGWDTVGPLFLMGGLNRRHPNQHDLKNATSFAARIGRQPVASE